ncbi:MAG: glycosyltransferase [Coriobacteriia bacterium]|nr:glycosyltransferase [Coriobacteriia bacterium]
MERGEREVSRVTSRIPRVIHYIWFGGNPKPELVVRCIDSWRRFMPDWEIIEWNESNYDVSKSPYIAGAYAARMWAFASDYARFDILGSHGGIYLDTDVELLRPILDDVLANEAFAGMESGGAVNPGLIFGCTPSLGLLGEIMDSYETSTFDSGQPGGPQTVNRRVTNILLEHGFRQEDVLQTVAGLTIYPSEFFCGYDQDVHRQRVTPNTISVHHYAHTWGAPADRARSRLQRALYSLVGDSNYRKLLYAKRRLLGVRGS